MARTSVELRDLFLPGKLEPAPVHQNAEQGYATVPSDGGDRKD